MMNMTILKNPWNWAIIMGVLALWYFGAFAAIFGRKPETKKTAD